MNKQKPTVYLICGFIGAGKTSFAKKLEERTGAVRVTKDEWSIRLIGNNPAIDGYAEWDRKITALSRDFAFYLSEKGNDVILDEGFWERKTREEMKERATAIGARLIMYYLETPIEKIRERVMARNNDLAGDSFEISQQRLDAYRKYWEPPREDEEFIVAK